MPPNFAQKTIIVTLESPAMRNIRVPVTMKTKDAAVVVKVLHQGLCPTREKIFRALLMHVRPRFKGLTTYYGKELCHAHDISRWLPRTPAARRGTARILLLPQKRHMFQISATSFENASAKDLGLFCFQDSKHAARCVARGSKILIGVLDHTSAHQDVLYKSLALLLNFQIPT